MTGSRGVKNSLWHDQSLKIFGTLILLVFLNTAPCASTAGEATWKAPASADAVKNPVKPTPAGLKDAQDAVSKKLRDLPWPEGREQRPGGRIAAQKPANFTDAKMMRKATDGELFWKMTTGRAPMPSWQDKLSETQRWELVNYFASSRRKGSTSSSGTRADESTSAGISERIRATRGSKHRQQPLDSLRKFLRRRDQARDQKSLARKIVKVPRMDIDTLPRQQFDREILVGLGRRYAKNGIPAALDS